MKRLLPLVLLVFLTACENSFKASSPAGSYQVLAGDEEFTDSSIMLLKHLSRLTPERSWERQIELARINDINDWNAYKEKLLSGYQRSLGLPFPEKTPLKAERIGVLERGSYRIENILYQSMPEIYVTANLYIPQEGEGPFPGILFPCGHSLNGKAYESYHGAALGLVQKGYVVLVFDPVGQGERCQYLEEDGTPSIGSSTVEHSLLANPLFLLGKHLMAVRMWDAIRGIDYLLTRDEVDPDRIGCTGCSGGGTVTLHLAPLEPRIKVVVPVGTVSSPNMALGSGGTGDGEQNLTRLVPEGITHADLMMLAYPSPYRLILESRGGVRRGTWDSFVQARFLYETLGHPERMTYVETEWPHGYFKAMREPMYFWFGKWLYGRKDDSREPELKPEEEKNLLCSKSGQILNERGKSICQWTSELVEKILPEHQAPENPKMFDVFCNDLRSEIEDLLNKPIDNKLPLISTLETFDDNDITIEKLIIYSEEDIYLPSLFYKAIGAPGKVPTVILIDSQGKTADGGALARKLASSGFGVLALDLRGMGETRTKKNGRDRRGGFQAQTLGVDAGMAYDGLKLGVSIFAMRVYDLLKTTDYLLSRDDVNREVGTAIIGKSSCGPLALYAAALEERIKGVLVDSSLASFRELTLPGLYYYNFIDFLPGVLSRHDLPQVAGSLAPEQVWILNALDSQKNLKEKALLEDGYRFSRDCYRVSGARDNFQIRTYSTARERLDNYLEWTNKVMSGK
jgi:cephalosporin-C deacetylase-like acetyl esterase